MNPTEEVIERRLVGRHRIKVIVQLAARSSELDGCALTDVLRAGLEFWPVAEAISAEGRVAIASIAQSIRSLARSSGPYSQPTQKMSA